ncbi:MAG: patatin-like phospholipase family protein [Fulvimarina manganoxydans]|uniref:patatin-like phospholipase family protein n=1 Tax=Fulvimarina manganoxydans TaxID=937218 RepID=UPI002352EC2F|nr:patatin-like phospholipase family protein [Fulvimarina manganoxydans]MCK5934366.1 patatin-like phospholipase family protein [Fulvimarina manganoxydans]
MKAYAVLEGGGVKGAALAGCLKGAEELNVEFVGYGGTSAGSIVALLASVGYTPDELLSLMCDEFNFKELLDDNGDGLSFWGGLVDDLMTGGSILKVGASWWKSRGKIREVLAARGVYSGERLEAKLREFIVRKHRSLENAAEITFADLARLGCKPLRVVAANLQTRRGVLMGDLPDSPIQNVLTAVRASCSYTFLFRPVMLHRAALVDGGLASNLPVWLFDEERDRDGFPLLAFDLTTQLGAGVPADSGVKGFLLDMLETGLESGDALLRGASSRLMHIEVPIASDVRTLDFALTSARRRALYNDGQRETQSFFLKRFGEPQAILGDPVGQLEAVYGDRAVFQTVLAGFVQEVASAFPNSGNLRCHVMFPYGGGDHFVIVYQHGMDGDADVDLQLARNAGPPGDAVRTESPIVSDWASVRARPEASGMSRPQVNKVPTSRRAIASVPVFDLRRAPTVEDGVIGGLNLVGALSVDSDRSAADAAWENNDGLPSVDFVQILKRWADVVGRVLN